MGSGRDLTGKVAIVTGASAGLGEQFCHGLAERGADVALAARRGDLIEKVAAEVEREHGVRTLVVPTDVCEEQDIIDLVGAAVDGLGGLDILINNAGTLVAKPVFEQTLEDWNLVMTTNLTSTFLACREAGRVMAANRSGSIVNISSIFGFAATKQFTEVGYYASKGGMVTLTKALAVELGASGVRVNAIAPGFFPTDMGAGITEEVRRDLVLPRTALPYTASNEMIRGAACFLAGDESLFVTGETLVVDGGHLAL